jgi:hypothetical protein
MVHVGVLVNHGEEQNEDRKLRIDVGEVVIAAFIDEDEVITERGGFGHGSGGFVAKGGFHLADGGGVDAPDSATGCAGTEANSCHGIANG